MKTQRRRERLDRLTTSDSSPVSSGTNGAEVVDGADGANGVDAAASTNSTETADRPQDVASLESNGKGTAEPVTATNAKATGNGSATPDGGGHPGAVRPAGTTITLPKRRRRTDTTSAIASSPPERSKSAPAVAPEKAAAAPARTPVVAPTPAPEPAGPWRLWLTYENLFWFALFAFTIVTRLWDLGNRGIHHDESLHAVFSHTLYKGGGYIHDPMMHGPLQFHVIAAMYWLFGATDATARLASVFCGVFVVMSPFFLRRQMGRLTAMICAFLLFISPSILYFSRMAREDAIFSGMEMIMLVGLWRFISMRKPADFYLFCAGLALMLTIKESAYLTFAVLAIFMVLMFAYQSGFAILGALGGYLASMGVLYMVLHGGMKNGTVPQLPTIPDQGPRYEQIVAFAGALFQHPLVQGAIGITAVFTAIIVGLFIMRRSSLNAQPPPAKPSTSTALPSRRVVSRPNDGATTASGDGHAVTVTSDGSEATMSEVADAAPNADSDEASEVWDPSQINPKPGSILGRYQPGSLPHLVGSLFSRPSVLLIGFLIAATIFIVFYTVFFSDTPRGIVSGLFASVGYWMHQQGVERGGQPWFYYMLLIPIYEPIAVFFSLAATIFFSWRGVRWLVRRFSRSHDGERVRRLGLFNTNRHIPLASFDTFFPVFLIWWLFGVFFIYSWAGEKMPWLMVHMVRPAIFLASLFIGALVASVIARRRRRIEEARLLEEEEGYYEDRRIYGRPTRATGALFNLSGVTEMARNAGLAPRKLATDTGPASTYAYSTGGGGGRRSSAPPPPPPRRGTSSRVAPQATYVRAQDPPWVTWNRPESLFPFAFFLTAFAILTMAWGLKMNALVYFNKYVDWGWSWAFPIIILLMVVLYAVWVGPGRALRYLGIGILAMGLMYQFRSAIMLTYNQPDVPKEMAVYVQTSPDVTRSIRELETFANYSAGGKKQFRIMYDEFTSWPMEWYLRDYNKHFIGNDKARPEQDQPVLFLEFADHNTNRLTEDVRTYQTQMADLQKQPASPERDNQIRNLQSQAQTAQNLLSNYVQQRYAMRWWFPEEWYKSEFLPGQDPKTSPFNQQIGGALNTAWVTISQPNLTGTLWKYLVFRETPKPLGSEDMIVLLRRDIAQQYHYLQYPPPASTDVPVRYNDTR